MTQGQSILAYQPRRPVPWRLFDVVVAIGLYFAMPTCVVLAARDWFAMDVVAAAKAGANVELDTAHPLARVLLESPSAWAILVCVAMAVVIAPVTEEIIFRLVVQGWLEAVELHYRRRRLRVMPIGSIPVLLTSLWFAALHFRPPSPRMAVAAVILLICLRAAANLLTVVLTLGWLRLMAGATLADLGVVPRKLAADVKLGVLAFLAATVPVYAVLVAAKMLLPDDAMLDPIPLFLLAVVLGGLYFRTHRIVPSIVLHMAFNAAGIILALWVSG